jgi:hypothetical protein
VAECHCRNYDLSTEAPGRSNLRMYTARSITIHMLIVTRKHATSANKAESFWMHKLTTSRRQWDKTAIDWQKMIVMRDGLRRCMFQDPVSLTTVVVLIE